MDVAHNQHSQQARRKNRSTTNLNHLTLAPLTTKLPLSDPDDLPDAQVVAPAPRRTTSYLQGKSAPTTPGLLSRSPARSRSHDRRASSIPGTSTPLSKSRSATHLSTGHGHGHGHGHGRRGGSGAASPNTRRRRDDPSSGLAAARSDSDWLLRAGALISSGTRESKGQSWLATRESSTSLTGMRGGVAAAEEEEEEEAFERELARDRGFVVTSRDASRRGSLTGGGGGGGAAGDDGFSPAGSRLGSRSHSRAGSRTQMLTPMERHSAVEGGYFFQGGGVPEDESLPGPDFVNLDEKLEAIEQDTTVEDEDHVRRLVKREKASVKSWFGNVIGWPLFAVQENDEEGSDDGDGDGTEGDLEEEEEEEEYYEEEDEDGVHKMRRSSVRQFDGVSSALEDRLPPPKPDEGGWQDAAWLLSVASKVIL